MTWIKIDDTLPNNPKILPLSDKAFRLYIEALCYANQYLTDGFLPMAIVKRLDTGTVQQELIEAGLWLANEEGMQIHDYCEHQTSKAQIEAKRDNNRSRVMRYRGASNAVSNAVSNANVTTPEYRRQNTEDRHTTSFDEFWNIYPRKVGKAEAERAYLKALKVATPEQIIAGAKKYADDKNRIPIYTAHPSTWLNQGRWEDEPIPSREAQTAPTWSPPAFDHEEIAQQQAKAVPMPEEVKRLLKRIP